MSLFEDHQNQDFIWIGTAKSGLNRNNRRLDTFEDFHSEEGISNALKNNAILSILQDKQGVLYVGTQRGLYRFNSAEKKLETIEIAFLASFPVENRAIHTMLEDNQGQLTQKKPGRVTKSWEGGKRAKRREKKKLREGCIKKLHHRQKKKRRKEVEKWDPS